MSRLLLTALGLFALTAQAAEPKGAEWPCFRGPQRNDISPDKGLLKSWPADGPKLVWKGTGVGSGFSTVSLAAGKVFTMGDLDGKCHCIALDAKTGKKLWASPIGAGGTGGGYRGSRGTPTYDAGLVFCIGPKGDLVCFSADKGEEQWRKAFKGKDLSGRGGGWEYSESPLIDGDRLICTPGGSKATLLCLDKKTGKEIWRTAGGKASGSAGYSSAVISNAGGVKQYVQLVSSGTIGVNAKSGELMWYYDKFNRNTANIPTSIVLGDQVLTVAGYRKAASLLTLKKDGNKFSVKEEWSEYALRNKHGGVVVVGDLMFGDTDDGGAPYCAKWKTGKTVWKRGRREGKGSRSASLTYADGNLYIRYQNGWMALVPADGTKYEEKGGFKIPDVSGPSWAHPVVIGGKLYLREGDAVLCYDVKGK